MARIKPQPLKSSSVVSNLLSTAQSSYYKVTLVVPEAVKSKLQSVNDAYSIDNINLLCCEASLPGSSLTTHEANNDYHGVTEKMAYRRMYDEVLSLTFYVDRDYRVIELFETWMNYISGVDVTNKSPYTNYRMAYPNSYKNNIFVNKFERDQFKREITGETTYRSNLEYTFIQAFPLSLTAIPVSYEAGEILKCNVSFNYIRYTMEKSQELVTESIEEGALVNTFASTVRDFAQEVIGNISRNVRSTISSSVRNLFRR